MLEAVSWYIIYFLNHFFDCYVFSKLVKEKYKINLKLILLCLFFSLVDSVCAVNGDILKMISSNITTLILLKIIYKKSNVKTLMGFFFITLGYAVAEVIYAVVFFLIFNRTDLIFDNITYMIVSNMIIDILYVLLYSIKYVVKLVVEIINWCDNKKIVNIFLNCILAMIVCGILMYPISFNSFNKTGIMVIFAVLIAVIVFIVGFFKEKSTNNKLSIEYSEMLDYSKTYEQEVEEKSKNQHEYKNQLILLDGMISNTNKKAKNYIKKLIDEENNINENDWMNKLKNLPNNGIKGFINFKIKKMMDNDIVVCVNIDNKLSTKKYWKNFEDNMEKVSKVLGVYLDNAIEAASNSSDKQIIIEFINNENNIGFILSNSYSGMINYSEMDKQGYSTKGKGRGYGLSLAKDIIKNSDILNSTREINGKFYVQKLYIKK